MFFGQNPVSVPSDVMQKVKIYDPIPAVAIIPEEIPLDYFLELKRRSRFLATAFLEKVRIQDRIFAIHSDENNWLTPRAYLVLNQDEKSLTVHCRTENAIKQLRKEDILGHFFFLDLAVNNGHVAYFEDEDVMFEYLKKFDKKEEENGQ